MGITADCGSWSVTWPWPQAIFGSYYTWAWAVADTDDCAAGIPAGDDDLILFELYCSTSDVWTGDYIASFGAIENINQVDIIDFGSFYAATAFGYSGGSPTITGLIRLPGISKPSTQYTSLETSQVPEFITGCNFNGQAVIGGIISTNATWEERGLSSVCWSRIGQFDFRPDEHQTAGYRDMDWGEWGEGIVYKVRKLGNYVVVFGDGGTSVLIPRRGPAVTFGYKRLPIPGVRSGNHIAGDQHVQAVIDTNYDLWLIDSSMKPRKLGYREWFQDLLTYTHESNDYRTLATYVPSKKRFYFSNGNDCYVLTEYGLYTCHQNVTSAGDYRGKVLCGFFEETADYEWRAETAPMNFNQAGFKTLQHAVLQGHYVKSTYNPYLRVKYKNDVGSVTYSASDWKELNPQGALAPIITAQQFKVGIKGTDYRSSELLLDSIDLKIKVTDKHLIRGI